MSNFPLNLRLKQRSVLPSTGVTPPSRRACPTWRCRPLLAVPRRSFPTQARARAGTCRAATAAAPARCRSRSRALQGLGTQGFGGPDFITPQEAQFACVYDPNEKENLGMGSPANLSPGRHKRPRFGYDPRPSQPDPSQLGSQGPLGMNPTPMSQGWNAGYGSQSQAALSQATFSSARRGATPTPTANARARSNATPRARRRGPA